MAQEVIIVLKDDLDGSTATGTLKFAYDGVHYEIDLSDANRARMDKVLKPYIDAARRTGGRQTPGSKKSPKSKASAIREWAMGEGLDVNPTGIVPKHIVQAYEKAQGAA